MDATTSEPATGAPARAIPSHVAPEVPGSIHEGGELGCSLMHAYGAAFDNPDLVVFCVVGDGEAETGPPAASWLSNAFLNPARETRTPCCPPWTTACAAGTASTWWWRAGNRRRAG
jgi:hypothetical protein